MSLPIIKSCLILMNSFLSGNEPDSGTDSEPGSDADDNESENSSEKSD